jgi:outer membrane immunogenic protein
MTRLLTIGIATLAALASGAASAADLPPRPAPPAPAPVFVAPVYNWTGFYLGINGGGAWAEKCWTRVLAVSEGCHNPNGGVVGGQVGFNWQIGQFVIGAEGTGDWASLTGNNTSVLGNVNTSKVDAIWSATARLGFAWDAVLLYAKGGGAWVSDKYSAVGIATSVAANETRSGWTVGGGFEYGFAMNWSVGLAYDHFDFGTKGVAFTGVGAFTDNVKQTIEVFTARVNYRFGPSAVVARY